MKRIFALIIFSLALAIPISAQEVARSAAVSANCGDIIEGEFAVNYEEQKYILNLEPGTSISARITPLGQGLSTGIFLSGPTGIPVVVSGGSINSSTNVTGLRATTEPEISTEALGARGAYTIHIINFNVQTYYDETQRYAEGDTGGVGVYTLYIGCTLRDGTVIEPGDSPSDEPTTSPIATVAPNCIVCSPAIPPVDLSDITRIPMPAGVAMGGAVTATGSEIIGYTFEANADAVVNLDFSRISGNLNLGLVVLAADNSLIYQASLIVSESMNTHLRIPTTGTYTIAVYRIDLIPVSNPEATAFQVQVTVE